MSCNSVLSNQKFPCPSCGHHTILREDHLWAGLHRNHRLRALEGSGVILTTLCPSTVETPFHNDTTQKNNAMSANKPMSADVVSKAGVEHFLNGKVKKMLGL